MSPSESEAEIDLQEIGRRLRAGLPFILGLTLIGLALGAILNGIAATRQPAVTTVRVTFTFPGFERGLYPNEGKFLPDDLRAPDVINEAVKRLGLNAQPETISRLRGAVTISGFVSPATIKERDRLRATGQNVPPYYADEYEMSLSLPRHESPTLRQRELLLTEMISVYLEKFRRNYIELPPEFGNMFNALNDADFVEYELVLTRETQALAHYLSQQAQKAGNYRSPSTGLSFQDLQRHTEIFTQVRLNDVLGVIYINGLSRDREYALLKMDYFLRTLEDQEQRLREEEAVVLNLLARTQERSQNYVMAVKDSAAMAADAARNAAPVVDQNLIDALLANDAYNFLVRRALESGLSLKRVESDRARLLERRRRMQSFNEGEFRDQQAAIARTQHALRELETSYKHLLERVRMTLEDFTRQLYGDAVRISMHARTTSLFSSLLTGAAIGATIALAAALGISLLRRPDSATLHAPRP